MTDYLCGGHAAHTQHRRGVAQPSAIYLFARRCWRCGSLCALHLQRTARSRRTESGHQLACFCMDHLVRQQTKQHAMLVLRRQRD